MSTARERSDRAARIERLKMGDWSFGHDGIGTDECPKWPHHHHDIFCKLPTVDELQAAGINPNDFKARSRRR